MNMFEATVERANGGLAVAEGQRLQISGGAARRSPGLKAYEGRTVIVGVRPENLEDASLVEDAPEDARLRSRSTEALGSELMVHFTIEAKPAVTEDDEARARRGRTVSERTEMVGRFDRIYARDRERRSRRSSTRSLHFFDPETGAGDLFRARERSSRHEQEQPYAARPCCRIPPAAARGLACGGGDDGDTGAVETPAPWRDRREGLRKRVGDEGSGRARSRRKVPGRHRRVQRAAARRHHEVQPGRRQPADRALDSRRGR